MKTISTRKVTKAVQAALVAGIAMTSSVSAMSAAPEAPTLDWVEVTEQFTEHNASVLVDVGWSHFDFDEVSSVQYRLDGRPVMSREVQPYQTTGDGILTIEDEGNFDLTVALCNVEGCTASEAMTISISEEEGVNVLISDVPAGTQALAAQGPFAFAPEATLMPELPVVTLKNAFLPGLGSELGKAALSGIVRAGADGGFGAVLKFLGMSHLDLSEQVSELQSSVGEMKQDIQDLTVAIEALGDQASWEAFVNQHKDARIFANQIIGAYESIAGYLATGELPDREGWTEARAKVVENIEALAGTRTGNGGGIVDDYDGAIYKLMNAIPQRVTSVESYWPIIEEYRDYYRMTISLGVLTLDLIADEYDDTITTRVEADKALGAGQAAVFNMYNYGIAPETPMSGVEHLDFVQLRGSTNGYATREYANLDALAKVKVAGSALREDFTRMASEYRPAHHGGLTLEQFLTESKVPTTYVLKNSGGGTYSTGWKLILQNGSGGANKFFWEPRPLIGQFKNNDWVESYERYCPSGAYPCDGNTDWFYGTSDQVKAEVSSRMATIKSAEGYTLNNGRFAESHYGAVDLTDRLNHAGRAAEMDEALVRLAAFGDGAARLDAGMLPDGSEGSQCIGLPGENLYLMEVENFDLRWQPNGNLTLRDNEDQVLWTSGTANKGKNLCFYDYGNLQIDNNVKLNFSSDTSDWDLGGYGGRTMKLHQDGSLQIINELDDVVWQVGPFE